MPPKAVRSIQDLIFWQYAKIISESARYGKKQWRFVMDRFQKLSSGEVNWSSSIREYVKEREKKDVCIYCGKKAGLTLEHILPRSRGGRARIPLIMRFLSVRTATRQRAANVSMNGLALRIDTECRE